MKKKQKISKKTILGMIGTVLALAVVVFLIVIFGAQETIDDNYLKTDNTKIVISIAAENIDLEDSEYEPKITHTVYYHDGTKIKNVKLFYEYNDETEAEKALNEISIEEFGTTKTKKGKYIEIQAKKETFDGATVKDVEKEFNDLKAIRLLVNVEDEEIIDDEVTEDEDAEIVEIEIDDEDIEEVEE